MNKKDEIVKLILDLSKRIKEVEISDLELDNNKLGGSCFVKFKLEAPMEKEKITLALIYKELKEIKSDVAELKSDVAELKSDVAELKSDVAELKSDVALIKECPTIKKELKNL